MENIEQGFLQIAKVCGLEKDVTVVKRWLSNAAEPWALIFDNADDPSLNISTYFPVGDRGIILITTRNPNCEIHATVGSCELGQMATDEAVSLVLKTAGVRDLTDASIREAAKQVVLTLGCLALAIVQAGAVIREGHLRIDEYCDIYYRRREELLKQQAVQGNEGYLYTVYTTWEVSIKMIERTSNEVGHDALELLRIFGFLHYNGIPEEIFHRAWGNLLQLEERLSVWPRLYQPKVLLRQSDSEWDVYPLRKALSVLSSYSLITRDQNSLISIHPLVHTWARDRLSILQREKTWIQTVSITTLSIPWNYQTADFWFRKSIMPHIDACLGFHPEGIHYFCDIGEYHVSMTESVALLFEKAGRYQEALQLQEMVVETRKKNLGEEHRETLASMHNLVVDYSYVGRHQEALRLIETVVSASKNFLGEEHLYTLHSMQSLAIGYRNMGRHQEALSLMKTLVEMRKRLLGKEHPDTLFSMHNLAIDYSEMGQYQEALLLSKTIVEARKKVLGEEHPDTFRSMYSLALHYDRMDQHQEALSLFKMVVKLNKRILGEEHIDTLRSMHGLALHYDDMGRRQEALELMETVINGMTKSLGNDHSYTVLTKEDLAWLEQSSDK